MTPAQAARLTAAVLAVADELHALRGFMIDEIDRVIVAVSSVTH